MTNQRSVRLLRAGLVGSLIVVLGAGGHVAGGGALPRPEVMIALCAVTMIPVLVMSSFRFSVPVLVGLMAAGQGWLHWSFGALVPGQHFASGLLLPASGHSVHLPTSSPGTFLGTAFSSLDAGGGWPMMTAHAIASVVAALFLARGEDAVRLVVSWLKPLVQVPEFNALPPVVSVEWPAGVVPSPATTALRLPARRGPPAVHAAA